MATAVQMPALTTRPSMDRAPSFDSIPRSRSTPPYTSYPNKVSNQQSFHHPPPSGHSRTHSNASSSSPYTQPAGIQGHHYSSPPPQLNYYPHHPFNQSWASTALPASAFYPNGASSPFSYTGTFTPGFQMSQPDFGAWANMYGQMMTNGAGQGQGQGGAIAGLPQPSMPAASEYTRRRTNSGPSSSTTSSSTAPLPHQYPLSQIPHNHPRQTPSPSGSAQPQPGGFHPYKRAPGQKPSRENISSTAPGAPSTLPRSASNPTSLADKAASVKSIPPSNEAHKRAGSLDSTQTATITAPPKRPEVNRRDSSSSDRSVRSIQQHPSQIPRASTPLYPGPISHATSNMARPSPLSQSNTNNNNNNNVTSTQISETSKVNEKPKSLGFKSRLKASFGPSGKRDSGSSATTRESKSSAPPVLSTPSKSPATTSINHGQTNGNGQMKGSWTSPSETSTRSATPPATPPQDLTPPHVPFAITHHSLGSDISLAETERTTTTAVDGLPGTDKKKSKSLFRMRNMSTDNISLSSTVSSASMMIRKMGSLGKLARRNSLAGISKIFKDKPKDEDAGLPELEVSKKERKQQKKAAKKAAAKGAVAPAQVSHTVVENEQPAVGGEEDNTMIGLSPAAKLARQHTLKSRAVEQARKSSQRDSVISTTSQSTIGESTTDHTTVQSGEPTWDNNTVNNKTPGLAPPIPAAFGSGSGNAPEVLHITPRSTSTMVQAVTVDDAEYDSDDSSDGETVEDLTAQMGRLGKSSKGSVEADREFQQTWGNAYIDPTLVPKKSILKTPSMEKIGAMSRQQSFSTDGSSSSSGQPPFDAQGNIMKTSPAAEHLEFTFDSPQFDASLNFPYQHPNHNTSAPSVSLYMSPDGINKPNNTRAMTAPAGPRRKILWAPNCAVYTTYDAGTYDRRSGPATCNQLTPQLAMEIKQELNAFKLEMPVHPDSRVNTHYFPW